MVINLSAPLCGNTLLQPPLGPPPGPGPGVCLALTQRVPASLPGHPHPELLKQREPTHAHSIPVGSSSCLWAESCLSYPSLHPSSFPKCLPLKFKFQHQMLRNKLRGYT